MEATQVIVSLGSRRLRRYVYLLAIAALVGLAIVANNPIKNQLLAWEIWPKPAHLTELYFADNKLPTSYHTNQPQTIAFTVHNIEGNSVTYRYTAYESSAQGARRSLASHEFTLASTAYQTIRMPVVLAGLGQRVYVSIELQSLTPTGVDESIGYWLTNTVGTNG